MPFDRSANLDEHETTEDQETEEQQQPRPDLPEYTNYRDEGCLLEPSCLQCPLPRCAHEMPGGINRVAKDRRNDRVLKLAHQGHDTRQISRVMDISMRSVQRILKHRRISGVTGNRHVRL